MSVGDIGFADFKRDFEGAEKFDLKGLPEMGWVLSPSVHGKGYATEAVSAALAWAEDVSKLWIPSQRERPNS
jgi:RimJ/RimL family protein N-acetyltransferase